MAVSLIPDLNLFMMCEHKVQAAFSTLPESFYFDLCRGDELDIWKRMHFDFPDAEALSYMNNYFDCVYREQKELFFSRCLFVRNQNDQPVASCFIWKAYQTVNTLHWLKVKREYENLGIGRALLSRVLGELSDSDFPVFLHTQPSSFRAIKLYTDFGFSFITDPMIGFRKNELADALPILQRHMPEKAYRALRFCKAPAFFLEAASSSPVNEF
ncbi:MAG: GNAT family N-acetyltransferase [Ruminococcaceae bacterium]|nr:GNAT family N-acetyltransferase [Oscillospiraceae bacterium]